MNYNVRYISIDKLSALHLSIYPIIRFTPWARRVPTRPLLAINAAGGAENDVQFLPFAVCALCFWAFFSPFVFSSERREIDVFLLEWREN